jgi:hypothetical protein
MAFGNSSSFGSYSPTTFVFDVAQLQNIDVNSVEFKELLIRLYQNLNLLVNVVNVKESAYYITKQEFLNGQQWFPNPTAEPPTPGSSFDIPNRQDYRTVLYLTAVGSGATTVAHNIPVNSQVTFTKIYGVGNDTSGNNYYPLPWASAAGATNIELKADKTTITITNNSGIVFAIVYVILEYLKF